MSSPHTNDESPKASTARGSKNPEKPKGNKPPNTARVARPPVKVKNEQVICHIGVGTVGLGNKGENDHQHLVQNSFKDWNQKKKEKKELEAKKKEDQPWTPRTHREVIEYEKQMHRERLLIREDQNRARAEAETKERISHRTSLNQRREEELAQLQTVIQAERERDRAKRANALSSYTGYKADELRKEREKQKEDREVWQKMIEEEKKAERERLMEAKAVWRKQHEAALDQQKQDAAERKALIEQEKRKHDEKLQKWKNEMDDKAKEQGRKTVSARHDLNLSLHKSRVQHQTLKHDEVQAVRQDYAQVKNEVEIRKAARERELHDEVEETKKGQISTYSEKKEKLLRDRQRQARKIKRETEKHRQEHFEDMQEHAQIAAQRRKEVLEDLAALRAMREESEERKRTENRSSLPPPGRQQHAY